MRSAIVLFAFLWFVCGGVGYVMLDDSYVDKWRTIARGPITLVRALKEQPDDMPEVFPQG